MQPVHVSPDPSSTGLDPKVAGLLCYLVGFITGIIFLIVEKKSYFVKFHAMQSTVVFGGLAAINLILSFIPIIGWLLGIIVGPLTFILWIALMLLALQGRTIRIPVISDFVDEQVRRF